MGHGKEVYLSIAYLNISTTFSLAAISSLSNGTDEKKVKRPRLKLGTLQFLVNALPTEISGVPIHYTEPVKPELQIWCVK